MSQREIDLVVENAAEVVPCRAGLEAESDVISNGSVAVDEGIIVGVGPRDDVEERFVGERVLSAEGKTVTPGFIDSHTHLIFAGTREHELGLKLQGKSYLEILEAGGGILRTVEDTRAAGEEELYSAASKTLDTMLRHGTTTVEAKSGYGLRLEDELKCLRVMRQLDEEHAVDVVSTFMGAHAVPPESSDSGSYARHIIDDMLPVVQREELAEFCDVFCERGSFSLDDSRRILGRAKQLGMKAKIHADELSRLGGAEVAAELRATSADHLIHASEQGLDEMAAAGVAAVLMPCTSLVMMSHEYADARAMLARNIPVAVATDFNPNCMLENMQLALTLSVYRLGLTPMQALRAATINAAVALDRSDTVGSLEVGKKADVLVLDERSHRFLGYHFGVNVVDVVVKDGEVVSERSANSGDS